MLERRTSGQRYFRVFDRHIAVFANKRENLVRRRSFLDHTLTMSAYLNLNYMCCRRRIEFISSGLNNRVIDLAKGHWARMTPHDRQRSVFYCRHNQYSVLKWLLQLPKNI
ncbi:hypothetical protein X941_4829 [Burkholderia pseudomallei MSHR5569]|nr:hypothetical protein X941_4829 [Burkholderia pseudomallei MSHR5569]